MILILAILFISFEAVAEGLLKKYHKIDWVYKWWLQWLIAFILFVTWFLIVLGFDKYIPVWKLIIGFTFIRLMIFDTIWNIANGQKWNYYGFTKLYDRVMVHLASFGWFMKAVCGIIGICFLMGWE